MKKMMYAMTIAVLILTGCDATAKTNEPTTTTAPIAAVTTPNETTAAITTTSKEIVTTASETAPVTTKTTTVVTTTPTTVKTPLEAPNKPLETTKAVTTTKTTTTTAKAVAWNPKEKFGTKNQQEYDAVVKFVKDAVANGGTISPFDGKWYSLDDMNLMSVGYYNDKAEDNAYLIVSGQLNDCGADAFFLQALRWAQGDNVPVITGYDKFGFGHAWVEFIDTDGSTFGASNREWYTEKQKTYWHKP